MPAIAIHSRTPSSISQHSAESPEAPNMSESHKKRSNFLRHFRSNKHNGDAAPKASDPPASPSPVKRATAPVSSNDDRERLRTPAERNRARSVSPRSPAPVQQLQKDISRNDFAHSDANGKRPTSNGSAVSLALTDSSEPALSPGAKPTVRWAEGVDVETSGRARRLSTASSATKRRSSIFIRNTEGGGYIEGVDHGAGSKARRLSVQLPQELLVEEERLEDHFDLLSRLGKKKIGEGGAACVQLMKSKTAGDDSTRVFAVKEFRPWDDEEETDIEYKRKIKSEYAIAKSLEHPNIVHTFRLCCSGGEEWFHVMEFCDLGDLNDLINKNFMNQEDKNCMFKQLLRGVEYLHSRGISHRDIKSENLLVNHFGCLKIADFGTSEVFCGEHPGARGCRRPSIIDADSPIKLCKPGFVGSRPYMAPEILYHSQEYDPRGVDVWSCAVVYLSLCFHGTPWDSASTENKNYNIFCASWDDWLAKHPKGEIVVDGSLPNVAFSKMMKLETPQSRHIVMGMLHPDPKLRWTAKQALEVVSQKEGPTSAGPWPCCQQEGYSDDIRNRERKARHNHIPPDKRKKNGEWAGK